MGNLLWPLKSRVRMAFLSAVVVAIITAIISFTPAGKQGANVVSHTIAAAAVGAGATATPASDGSGSNGTTVASAPTATPIPSTTTAPPTAPPTPTTTRPTSGGSSTIQDLHGTIASKGDTTTHSFQYTVDGGSTMTVYVNSNTQYEGATFPDGLTPGHLAEVTGIYTASGTFLAYTVHQEN